MTMSLKSDMSQIITVIFARPNFSKFIFGLKIGRISSSFWLENTSSNAIQRDNSNTYF
jgi:hypothetical protein